MKSREIALFLILLVFGCNELPTAPRSLDVEHHTLFRSHTTKTGVERREVIRDAIRWEQVWSELWIDDGNAPRLQVDFSREMIILSARGGGACDETLIERIISDVRSGIRVHVVDRQIDEAECGCVSVALNPVHVVAVRRDPSNVSFEVRNVTSCDSL